MADKVRYTPVDPTPTYPYRTDKEFIRRKIKDEPYADMRKNVPGIAAVPTMDLEGGAEGTGIFEIDGKFHVLPTQINGKKFEGEAAIERFRKTGEHLGVFHAEDDASIFEQNYLKNIGTNNKPALLQGTQSKNGGSVSGNGKTSGSTASDDALQAALKGSGWYNPTEKIVDPGALLQEFDHSTEPVTPQDMETRRKVQGVINERNRAEKMNETPLTTALSMNFNGNKKDSFFPGAQRFADNDLNDMLNSSPETQFLGKPAPTPTPTPVKPSSMNLAQLYNHFGVETRTPTVQQVQPVVPQDQLEQLRSQYGWNT